MLDNLHVRGLEQDQEKSSFFALFLHSKVDQSKLISHSSASLFISTIRPFNYNARERSKKWEARELMLEKRLFLNIEQQCSPVETWSTNQSVPGENFLEDAPRKKSLRNERKKRMEKQFKIINLNDLEKLLLQKRATRRGDKPNPAGS